MKLYYFPGACSMASHIVLNELDVSFGLEEVDTKAGLTKSGMDFSTINPRGYVPVVELDKGERITDNGAILQYLFDAHYEGAGAIVPIKRARLQEVLSFVSSELHKAFTPFFKNPDMPVSDRAAAEANLSKKVSQLEAMLPTRSPFFMGEEFTPADAYAFVVLNWSNFVGFSLSEWPAVEAYLARIARRPSVLKALRTEGLAA